MLKIFFIKIFFILSIFFSIEALANDYEILDKIVVIVEKDVITESEINKEIYKKIQTIAPSEIPVNEFKKIKKNIINELIEKKLIYQYALLAKLSPSEQEIDMTIQNILKNNDIDIETLEKELLDQKTNILEFKEDIGYQLIKRKIKDREIMPYLNISEYEVDAWLEKNELKDDTTFNIYHLLIKHENKKLEEVLFKLKNISSPNEFYKLSTEYSDGPYAQDGGDLGWLKLNELPEIFIDFIKNAKLNDISKPIESKNGKHIIMLIGKKNAQEKKSVFIRQYKFQQVLMKKNAITTDDEIEKKLENIKNLINDGLNFDKAVKLYSDDQFNIDSNNLKWVDNDNLLPEFRNNINTASSQSLIGPFRTEIGWHLVKIYESRETDITDIAVRDAAKIEIANKKAEFRFKDWLDGLIKSSKIDYLSED